MSKSDQERARDQAKAQFESIKEMIERLDHANDCTDEDCKEHEDFTNYIIDYDDFHNSDKAMEAIYEDPLEVCTRSDWESNETRLSASEYMILLCTGGPAVRIIGSLDEHKQPDSAVIEYQDWGTGWELLTLCGGDDNILLTYAQNFYFGE